jgi:hypothetical protein
MAHPEQSVIKDNTLMPAEWYGGRVKRAHAMRATRASPNRAERNGPKINLRSNPTWLHVVRVPPIPEYVLHLVIGGIMFCKSGESPGRGPSRFHSYPVQISIVELTMKPINVAGSALFDCYIPYEDISEFIPDFQM